MQRCPQSAKLVCWQNVRAQHTTHTTGGMEGLGQSVRSASTHRTTHFRRSLNTFSLDACIMMCPAPNLCGVVLSCSDNADLEAVLKETERQRREFAARYAFMTLDTDGDGYVSVEQVRGRGSWREWQKGGKERQFWRKTGGEGEEGGRKRRKRKEGGGGGGGGGKGGGGRRGKEKKKQGARGERSFATN